MASPLAVKVNGYWMSALPLGGGRGGRGFADRVHQGLPVSGARAPERLIRQ
jgi:hypothetical protein